MEATAERLRTSVPGDAARSMAWTGLLPYAFVGMVFGLVLVKSQVVSWFRIQEMFRFEAFHMYGVLFSAVIMARIALFLIRRLDLRSLDGRPIRLAPKVMGTGTRYWAGGTLFGLGWALTGACPGPLVALAGSGLTVYVVAFASAVAGTFVYGWLRPRLPH